MAKITLHIPTEQYGFVAVEAEDWSAERTAEVYREYAEAFKPTAGLTPKDWIKAVDEYCNTGTLKNGTELFYQMNDKQKFFFQELKKHQKRGASKNNDKDESWIGAGPGKGENGDWSGQD